MCQALGVEADRVPRTWLAAGVPELWGVGACLVGMDGILERAVTHRFWASFRWSGYKEENMSSVFCVDFVCGRLR